MEPMNGTGRTWVGTIAAFGLLLASACGEPADSTQDALRAQIGRVQTVTFQASTYILSNPPPAVDLTITDSGAAQDMANAILALPVMVGVASPSEDHCPADVGVMYDLEFAGRAGDQVMQTTINVSGCQQAVVEKSDAYDDVILTAAGHPDFWSRLAADLGLPEADIYPYHPPSP
jgi:hypothetical protein